MATSQETSLDNALLAGADISDINSIRSRYGQETFEEVETDASPFEKILANLESSNPELAEMTKSYAPDEGEGGQSTLDLDEELYSQLSTSVKVDSSASSAFIKKFGETKSFITSSGDYLSNKFKDSYFSKRWIIRNEDGEFIMPYHVTPSEYLGEDVTKLSDDEFREKLSAKRTEEIDNYYGDISTAGSPVSSGAGVLAGYLTDLTTAFPLGKTYKVAAGIGAALGASDVAMEQLARDGKVQVEDVALGAILGGTLGVVVKYGGDTFMPFLKDKLSRGEPVTAEEILYRIPEEFIESGKVTLESAQRLSNSLSENLDLSPKEYLDHSIKTTNNLLKGSDREVVRSTEEALFGERIATMLQDDVSLEKVNKLIQNEVDFRAKYNDTGFLSAATAKIDIDKAINDALKPVNKKLKVETPAQAEAKAVEVANFREKVVVEKFRDFAKRTGQGGAIAPWLMRDLGASTVGGLVGYTSSGGDLESAAMWAIGTGAIAHGVGTLGPKLYQKVGKMLPYGSKISDETAEKWGQRYQSYSWSERPSEYFKNVAGDTGHKFSNLLQRMNEDIRGRMSEDIVDIRKTMYGLKIKRKSAEEKGIVSILRDPKRAGQYSPEVREGAKAVREKLNTIVKDAMGRGIIKQDVGRKMLQETITEGYFPRVYDKFFLASGKGKEKWHEVFSNHKWTKQQIEIASKSILGEKKANFKRFKAVKDKKTGEIKYTVDNKFISELYKNNSKATFSNRSSHLEKSRKIDLPDEVLEPFLINDLDDVLASYFQDTQKRIQSAKYFGAQDQGMHTIIKEMKDKGLVKRELDAAWEVYWTGVGDPKSNSIRQMIEMPQGLRNFYSNAASLQIPKLIFAQTLNLTQATANSLIFLPSRVGLRTPKVILKGMANTFKKENREWAERIGAAAESTILEVAGEMGSLESRFATKFLKYSGFMLVEKVQRQLAANIGKAYVEELLEAKNRAFIKSRKNKLGSSGKKELNRINEQLNEMGINPDLSPNSIPIDQMNRAGQRFSNTVNFINTSEKMPLAWQSPHMKLIRQFKTYMFHQGAFLHDNLLKPFLKGDLRPIIGLAAAGGLGMGPSEIRKWLKADDEEYTMLERYLQGFMAIGGLGLMFDLAQQSAFSTGRFASSVLGPTVGTGAEVLGGLYRTGEDILKGEGTARHLGKVAANFPITGQVLDIGTVASQIGKAADIDVLKDIPTKKEVKEELKAKKKNPYNYYSNLYK